MWLPQFLHVHATLNIINSADASLIRSWNFTWPVTSCPRIDPHLRFGSILGHDVTGLVKFQVPSSPLQPPEFDMTLQILGVAEDYLANVAYTSSLQRTTYNKISWTLTFRSFSLLTSYGHSIQIFLCLHELSSCVLLSALLNFVFVLIVFLI